MCDPPATGTRISLKDETFVYHQATITTVHFVGTSYDLVRSINSHT
jgi:hypothetical protein